MGLFGTSGVVKFKDGKVCILLSQIGNGAEFNKEFSRSTAEGYELKATHPFASFKMLGTGGDTDHLFYFQKLDSSKNQQKHDSNNLEPSSGNVVQVKFCNGCGTSNISGAIICKKCGRGL